MTPPGYGYGYGAAFGGGRGRRRQAPSLVPLFQGQFGLWYNNDRVAPFQTHLAQTPAGIGDPCGFTLDLSKGAGYSGGQFTGTGPELIANHDFSSWTDPAIPDGWEYVITIPDASNHVEKVADGLRLISDGSLVMIVSSDFVWAPPGTKYLVEVDVADITGRITILMGLSVYGYDIDTAGLHRFLVPADGDDYGIGIKRWQSGQPVDATIRSISAQVVPGNHATQPVSANRATLGLDSAGRRRAVWDTDDFGTFPQAMPAGPTTIAIAYDPVDLPSYVMGFCADDSAVPWVLAAESGSDSTNLIREGSINGIWIDGTSLSISGLTRGALWSAMKAGSTIIFQFDNTGDENLRRIGVYFGASEYLSPNFSQFLLIDKYLDADERALVNTVMRMPS